MQPSLAPIARSFVRGEGKDRARNRPIRNGDSFWNLRLLFSILIPERGIKGEPRVGAILPAPTLQHGVI